jgi:hypothetical protein
MTNPLPTLPNVPNTLPKSQPDWQAFQTVLNQWKQGLGPPKWVAPTLLHSWANSAGTYPPTGYCIDLTGRVWLRGLPTGGLVNTIAFVLPLALPYSVILGCNSYVGGAQQLGYVGIAMNGSVTLGTNQTGTVSYFSLDGLSFSLLA